MAGLREVAYAGHQTESKHPFEIRLCGATDNSVTPGVNRSCYQNECLVAEMHLFWKLLHFAHNAKNQ